MNNNEAVTRIIEAIAGRTKWSRIAEVAVTIGATPAEIKEAVATLLADCDDFRAEPEPFGFRITEADKAYAPVLGGEARHLIMFS